MDNEVVLQCVKSIWQNLSGTMLAKGLLLILDSFRGNLVGKVKEELRTDTVDFHGSFTGMLQPLGVNTNRPFKAEFRRQYAEWMANSTNKQMLTKWLKRVPLVTVLG